ncbi:hypothetical protein GCM10023232_18770 [Sphingosinicella ginsenosidimutans]|uniref:Uncharacterized protein n=1 Tax=Allosphingosinicella ginsenosidimutans TaxID=1176539 RepID=A0A5C6TSC8_9SPHN|nr:hypothetical protein [Sphingosinicella ginsenosidimutans]TXC62921.1 hypothetical protein FRZ32_04100 [Sphingosinicella ginsenosidimutans]
MLLSALPASAQQQNACIAIEGARVVTEDGDYLGTVASPYAMDSIFNRYGRYGSKYQSNSIWNDYGRFGSAYSTTSARSEYASRPPLLIKNRQVIGRLSTNRGLQDAINPVLLGAVCYDYTPDG